MNARRRPPDPSPDPSERPAGAAAGSPGGTAGNARAYDSAGDRELQLPRATLTRTQDSVLDAIIFLMRRGEIPTIREVGALTNLRSPATVLKHLRALERAGWITLSGKSRGIRLADHSLLSALSEQPDSAAAAEPAANRDALLQAHIPQASSLGNGRLFSLRAARRSAGVPLVGAIAAGRPFQSFAEGFLGSDDVSQDTGQDDFSQDVLRGAREGELFAGERPGGSVASAGELPIDPHLFVSSGETIALRVEGDSMIRAGILDGDYVIIRRQDTVEEGEIAAVLVNGEGTLKRWCTGRSDTRHRDTEHRDTEYRDTRHRDTEHRDTEYRDTEHRDTEHRDKGRSVTLRPENEMFDPIEIHEDDGLDVLVIGKYVGLVRGELQLL